MARQSKKPADPTQGVGEPLASKPRNGHGGARPNSGPKPSLARRDITDVNAITIAKLTEWLPDLLRNIKTLADTGDRKASEYLLNRLLGKPTERQEISGPDGGLIPIAFEQAAAKVWSDDDDHIQPD